MLLALYDQTNDKCILRCSSWMLEQSRRPKLEKWCSVMATIPIIIFIFIFIFIIQLILSICVCVLVAP